MTDRSRALNLRLGAMLLLYLVVAFALLLSSPGSGFGATGAPVDLTGELEIRVADDFERGRSETRFFVRDEASGRRFEVHLPKPPSGELGTGRRVRVRGRAFESVIDASEIEPAPVGDEQSLAPSEALASLEERRAVLLLVDLRDARASDLYSLDQIAENMWTGVRSTDGLFQAASHGQLGFIDDSDANGSVDAFGPFRINADSTTCDPDGWANRADDAARRAGVDLDLYQHRVYVLPRYDQLSCWWAGLGQVACSGICRAWIAEGESPMVYVHELGHNLGLAHASTDSNNDGVVEQEYGDFSDPMGSSRSWRVFNAPHADQIGWLDAFPGSVVDVAEDGVHVLEPMTADPFARPGPRALKIAKPDTGDFYYVSTRRPEGYDDSLSPEAVYVHRYAGAGYSRTSLIRALPSWGQPFVDALNDIEVRYLGTGEDGSATVEVSFGCDDPTASLSPADGFTAFTGESMPVSVSLRACGETFIATSVTLTPSDGSAPIPMVRDFFGVYTAGWSPRRAGPATLQVEAAFPGGPAVVTASGTVVETPVYLVSDDTEFEWIDATGGTLVPTGLYPEIPIGFPFPFYGVSHETVLVNLSNGLLTFSMPWLTVLGRPIPSVDPPNEVIAPYFDMFGTGAGDIYYLLQGEAPNRSLTIEWHDVTCSIASGSISYEITLHESGRIQFRYLDVTCTPGWIGDHGATAAVGIENATGRQGVQYSYQEPVLSESMTVTFRPAAQCEDGRDNDGDGQIDFPDDGGCRSSSDPTEHRPRRCGLLGIEALIPLGLSLLARRRNQGRASARAC